MRSSMMQLRRTKELFPQNIGKEPYMSREELRRELDEGIEMWGYEENGELVG